MAPLSKKDRHLLVTDLGTFDPGAYLLAKSIPITGLTQTEAFSSATDRGRSVRIHIRTIERKLNVILHEGYRAQLTSPEFSKCIRQRLLRSVYHVSCVSASTLLVHSR